MLACFFTECYHPIVNGVVGAIDVLRAGLHDIGDDVVIVAPSYPAAMPARGVVRIPSLPLPTSTGYRLCVPFFDRDARALLQRVHVVHAHSPFVTGWSARALARRRNIPLIFTYHTRIDAYAHYAPFAHRLTQRAMERLTRAYANAADAVIVPTRAMEARLRELGVRSRIAVIPSPIDVARFAAGRRSARVRAALGASGDEPLALTVARLGREKGLELALGALAHAPGVRLAIVGAGPHRGALEAHAAARGVADRVRFTGALAPAVMPDVYASADAFVFPSATETQGLVLAEALAAALPVVAVDVPVNREILGGTGRLVAADPAALGAALVSAAAGGRDLAGPAAARLRFDPAAQAKSVHDLYATISECRTFGTLGAHDAGEPSPRPH
jgi:glycosyltransferase involved in cell wall biosynthesis